MTSIFIVRGQVLSPTETPLANLIVRAYDRDLRTEQLLGEQITLKDGSYEISYTAKQFRRGDKQNADLEIRVFNQAGEQLEVYGDRERIIFNADIEENVTIILADDANFTASEYDRLLLLLNPILEGAQPASLSDEEIEFIVNDITLKRLENDFSFGKNGIYLLRESDRLALETDIPTAAFYGWGRFNNQQWVTRDETGLKLNLEEILAADDRRLRKYLGGAIEEKWIPNNLREQIETIINRLDVLRAIAAEKDRQSWETQSIFGRLLDSSNEESLANYAIRATDISDGDRVEDLGVSITDSEGKFSFDLPVPPETVELSSLVIFAVSEVDAEEAFLTKELQIRPNQTEEITLIATIPTPTELDAEIDLTQTFNLPTDLQTILRQQGINTLADLRQKGGLEELGISAEQLNSSELRRLEAQNNLFFATPQLFPLERIALNDKLIAKGFTSTDAIASQTQGRFLNQVKDVIDAKKAAEIYRRGKIFKRQLANDYINKITSNEEPDPAKRCNCEDCSSALSPGAYLAELLGYVQQHVVDVNTDRTITIEQLENTFFHPFQDLPISCAATQTKVRQVRLGVEVLLRYLGSNNIPDVKEYRTAAYEEILRQLGTSSDELRDLDDETVQKAIANRLAIPETNIEELILTENNLTEQSLETVFGLPATVTVSDAGLAFADSLPKLNQKSQPSRIQQLRLQYLKDSWFEQDFSQNVYDRDVLPIIEPDVINPDDFRVPFASIGSTAFQIWQVRREWIDTQITTLVSITNSDPNRELPVVLAAMFSLLSQEITYTKNNSNDEKLIPWQVPFTVAEAIKRNAAIKKGENLDSNQIWLAEHFLTASSLGRLVETLDSKEDSDLSKDRWQDATSILVNSIKRAFYSVWRTEEVNAGIYLDSAIFWKSLTEPTESIWSASLKLPVLIDPEKLERKDLLDSEILDGNSLELWASRKQTLSDKHIELQNKFDAEGLIAVIQDVFGNSPPGNNDWSAYLLGLEQKLISLEISEQNQATTEIQNLFLDVETFKTLLSILNQSANPDLELNSTEVAKVITVIVSAFKQKELYATWEVEEETLQYWRILKARLPKWRASQSDRSAWQQALKNANLPPIIEPDQINPDDFANAVPADPTFVLWQQRYTVTQAKLIEITNLDLANSDNFSNSLRANYIGINLDGFLALAEEEKSGISISDRLHQLSLSRSAYLYLLQIFQRYKAQKPISDDSWQNVFAILLQIWKQRQYAQWRREEQNAGISLNPVNFKIPPRNFLSRDSLANTVQNQWRTNKSDRRTWSKTLKSRIEQQKNVVNSLQEMITEVEELTLPLLRNRLIQSTDALGSTDEIKAKWLSDRLLIDMLASGCQTTTRISQAIETLQSLIFSLRTGQLDLRTDLKFKLDAENFEQQWKWLGSYGTWKAAMAVFLYPDNLLLPTLRRNRTPKFDSIARDINPSRIVTSIDRQADEYYNYFQDVCSLNVKATCWGRTYTGENTTFAELFAFEQVDDYLDLLYLFAQPENSTDIYWSTYDPAKEYSPNSYPQSFWTKFSLEEQEIEVGNIIGVVPYQNKLHLFVFLKSDLGLQIGLYHYDLEDKSWSELITLSTPENNGDITATILQSQSQDLEDKEPPTIICNLNTKERKQFINYQSRDRDISYSSYCCINTLNSSGNAFVREDWRVLTILPYTIYQYDLVCAIEVQDLIFLFANFIDEPNSHSHVSAIKKRSLKISLEEYPGDIESLDKYFSLQSQISFYGSLTQQYPQDTEYYQRQELELLSELNELGRDNAYQDWIKGHKHELWQTRGITLAARYWQDDDSSLSGLYVFSYKKERAVFSEFKNLNGLGLTDNSTLQSANINEFQALAWGQEKFTSISEISNDIPISIATHAGSELLRNKKILIYNSGNLGKSSLAGATLLILRPNSGKFAIFFAHDLAPKLDSVAYSRERRREQPLTLSGSLLLEEQKKRQVWILANTGKNASRQSNATYLNEAYYFLPLFFALKLQKAGQYKKSLDWFRLAYDYNLPLANREISYILQKDRYIDSSFARNNSWLEDPINPHVIAKSRENSYLRFTLRQIIRCLLDFGDAEFTNDTVESIAKARTLYTTATELLELPELKPIENVCKKLIAEITEEINILVANLNLEEQETWKIWYPVWLNIEARLKTIENAELLEPITGRIKTVLKSDRNIATKIQQANQAFQNANVTSEIKPNQQLTIDIIQKRNQNKAKTIRNRFRRKLSYSSSLSANTVDASFEQIHIEYVPNFNYGFCIPPNPIANGLILRAELNLFKIRNCLNIAGIKRELEPYAAPIDVASSLPSIGAGGQINLPGTIKIRPTLYRYPVLVERAKQLISLAQQIESTFFSTLQGKDQEAYSLFKAKQEIQLAKAGVKLQDLRVNEAEGGVELAQLQQERSQIQAETYQEWISTGKIKLESDLLKAYEDLANLQRLASFARVASQISQSTVTAASGGISKQAWIAWGIAVAAIAGEGIANDFAIQKQLDLNLLSFNVSFERRRQEWELQQKLSQQDINISNQQIDLAEDRIRIVGQERKIAQIQAEQADETVNFLENKFTSVELYDWMSNVLEDVYRYFLQQAALMAKLAENQLAFERQELPAQFIQSDYFEAPKDDISFGTEEENSVDRRGLTGSARLLQDIYKLDQYAFETNQRKLQLTETISLSQLDPFAFEQFRQTGKIVFETPVASFDRRFPGNYLRLIRLVRTSVIALVPPTRGITATLTSAGISRTVIKSGSLFQTTVIRRNPELVQFTSPINATGLFELNPQSEMLYPFEGSGVDTRWELKMPKADNPFDFNTIADVLITIDYTALHSEDYKSQVISKLDNSVSGDRAFSFRNEFADAWYDLHNPQQTDTPMSVTFPTRRQDFPPNIQDLRIENILLYFSFKKGSDLDGELIKLNFIEQGKTEQNGGDASPINSLIGTRKGNAGSWFSVIGKSIEGKWQLSLPNIEEVKKLFDNEEIQDILLVITYGGERS